MSDQTASPLLPSLAAGGIASFYRAVWEGAIGVVTRYRLAVVVEIAMILTWFVIRTMFDVDGRAYAAWVVVAGVLAFVAPLSGLVVFIGSSAFFEPDSFARGIALRELVILPLAAGVIFRIAADRFRWRPGAAVMIALLLLAGTAVSLGVAFARFDDDIAWHAARSWLGNAFAPIALLVAAAWTARNGELRALGAAVIVGVVVAVVCLVEYFSPGSVSTGPFAWVGFWKDFGSRLDGTIPSPNALSAQLIIPAMIALAAAIFAADRRMRLIAIVAALVLAAAHYLTFSRSPILGLYAFIVVAAWRASRAFGFAALAGGLLVGAALLPSYLAVRSAASGNTTIPGTILVASDTFRLQAWESATRMFLDAPLTGQGYLAYRELSVAFGDAVLRSPHNEWLRFFAEGGVLVGLLAIAFVVVATRELGRVAGWLGTGLTGGFLGYVLTASFNNPLLFLRVSAIAFPMIGAGLALAANARASARDAAPRESGRAPTVH